MKLFRKTFTMFAFRTVNSKRLLAYLILLITPLFPAFREPAAKQHENCADEPRTANIIFQSKDGGQTWEDISYGLPVNAQPEDFFAGKSDLYLRVKNEMYHSKSNLKMPFWEKENALDPRCTSVAFNHSGIMAFNYEGQIFQKTPAAGNWLPVNAHFKKQSVRTIYETSSGAVFVGNDRGLFKSIDQGRSWKQVLNNGWVMDLVESEGVLLGTSQMGIIRSTDNGEHWEPVISDGGVGIAVERINGGFVAIAASTRAISRRIYLSLDSGKTWRAIDEGLRPSLSISSIKQVGQYLICGHPDGIFRSSDMGKTWSLVHAIFDNPFKVNLDSDGRVFKIYVSGDVLYAVTIDSGC